MTVLETLLLAHVLGDWLLQTEWQAQNKRHSWRAMLSHVAMYHIVALVALVIKIGYRDPLVYIVVVMLAVSHAFLDRVWPVMRLMRVLRISSKETPERWLTVGVDQAIHFLLLGLASIVLSLSSSS